MKLVIVADIHGNHDALRALPEDYDELWRGLHRQIAYRCLVAPHSAR
jgi:hypothetical protein